MMPPIPLYEGTRPYQTIPFQWSLHASDSNDQASFLDTFQALAAEASDYSRRTLENRSSFIAKLFRATTFESAIQI
jgi:hypothetical protein